MQQRSSRQFRCLCKLCVLTKLLDSIPTASIDLDDFLDILNSPQLTRMSVSGAVRPLVLLQCVLARLHLDHHMLHKACQHLCVVTSIAFQVHMTVTAAALLSAYMWL